MSIKYSIIPLVNYLKPAKNAKGLMIITGNVKITKGKVITHNDSHPSLFLKIMVTMQNVAPNSHNSVHRSIPT
jgi:hypothetical protein